MKDYGQIITKIQDTPWLITEGGLRTILQIVESHINGNVSLDEIRARTDNATRERGSIPKQQGSVGVLPLHGPIFPKANLMTELSGATSMEQWQQDFRALMQNDRVESILLDIDSPGGSAFMIKEMADEIREARNEKPIYAVANSMAASAAYFLASQASELYATDSGIVGSVGTYIVHTDTSELEAKAGVTNTVIKEGKFKAALIQPLTPETREHLQGVVTEINDMFLQGVADGRKTTLADVSENYGEGGVVSAKKALQTGMVDGIRTFDEVLGALLDGGGTAITAPSNGKGASGFSLRASFDKEKEHSEPGTGSGGEPQDREPPEDEHIDQWNRGERLHRPPNIPELEERERNAMDREELLALAERLGVEGAADLEDAALSQAVTAKLDSTLELVSELQGATEQAAKKVAFAQAYPEEAERMAKLEKRDREHEATAFANSLADFEVAGEGENAAKTKFRLSVAAQDTVKETHLKLSQGNLVHDDLKQLIQVVATGGVQQGEVGSSRLLEDTSDTVPTNRQDARKAFTQKVTDLMENDDLDRKAAIAEAGRRYPELAQAYAQS